MFVTILRFFYANYDLFMIRYFVMEREYCLFTIYTYDWW